MEELIVCHTCDLPVRVGTVEPGTRAKCPRCGSKVYERKPNSLQRTAAFSLAALVLYIPANLYPILRMEFYGSYSESTIWDGCIKLFRDGMWFVALVVFLASIVVPLLKLVGLLALVVSARSVRMRRSRTMLFKVIDVVGPWAMLDVFLLAILVAVVKLEQLATVLPGPGIVAFTCVVILTILASMSFDPRLIWDPPQRAVANR